MAVKKQQADQKVTGSAGLEAQALKSNVSAIASFNANAHTSSQQQSFNRPPRIWTPPPQGTVAVPAPPAKEKLPTPPGLLAIMFPIMTMLVLIGVTIVINHGSLQEMTFLIPMAVLSIMYPLSNLLTALHRTGVVKRQHRKLDEQYKVMLQDVRKQLGQQVEEQRNVALLTDPDPADLEARIQEHDSEQPHLWERRPEDPDFLAVRVGRGSCPFSVEFNCRR